MQLKLLPLWQHYIFYFYGSQSYGVNFQLCFYPPSISYVRVYWCTVLLRCINIMMALYFYVVHIRCWKVKLKIQINLLDNTRYLSTYMKWICYPKRSICLQLQQELVSWLVHRQTQRKLSSMWGCVTTSLRRRLFSGCVSPFGLAEIWGSLHRTARRHTPK